MVQAFAAHPPCAVCGRPATHVELVAPGAKPADWADRSAQERDVFDAARQRHGDQQWWLIFSGIEAGNGTGDPVDLARATRIAAAFTEPYRFAAVTTAGFYDDAGFCGPCDAPYCHRHWNVSSTGYGTCPHGHGKSLDPFWWPDDL
ncbi:MULTISPECIES: hypothetical protein [Micromonospora]|uniref:hypothetical protein n=1 Tax=Micromonospora TaxID=1873 RepID=UPI001B36A4F8|nr:hypothetical protein [Micromonospora sp. C81]MBQ1034832.1 hypothetical protein [Micromonospora sp. C81]